MALRGAAMAASILLIGSAADNARAQYMWRPSGAQQELHSSDVAATIVTGRVKHIYNQRLFTIARDDDAPDQELLVFAPDAEASPLQGSRLVARGALRHCDDTQLAKAGRCDHVDDHARADVSTQPVLIARSLVTSTGQQLIGRAMRSPATAAIPIDQDESPEKRRNEFPITVRPGTLGLLVDSLAGRSIRLTSARVVGVFDPRVFLVDTRTLLPPIVERERVLVFIETGTLRVEPALLVASTVTLSGVARTVVGMQVSREVPWPPALTPDAVKRLDIRAALLASSVRTPEGIDLVARSSSASTPARSTPLGR